MGEFEGPLLERRLLKHILPKWANKALDATGIEVEHQNYESPIRIFQLKDKDHLPREFENEVPDKILIKGETVVYVFRVRPWLRRVR
jgi:hypothetical protein